MSDTKITRYGNSLAVRLPASLARELGLQEGDAVEVRRHFGALIIERSGGSRLERRLATVKERASEISSGTARGAENFD